MKKTLQQQWDTQCSPVNLIEIAYKAGYENQHYDYHLLVCPLKYKLRLILCAIFRYRFHCEGIVEFVISELEAYHNVYTPPLQFLNEEEIRLYGLLELFNNPNFTVALNALRKYTPKLGFPKYRVNEPISNRTISRIIKDILPPPECPGMMPFINQLIHDMVKRIIDEKDYEAMPVLADAMEDQGNIDPRIIAHCRKKNHYRGCWVLEMFTWTLK